MNFFCNPNLLIIFTLIWNLNYALSEQNINEPVERLIKESCSAENEKTQSCNPVENKDDQCTLYLAESSIPGAGFGVFTTRDIPKGFHIDSPVLSIVSTDDYYHNQQQDPVWAHVNYHWSGSGYATFEAYEVSELVVNLGTCANYHTYLTNVDHFPLDYNDAIVDRFKDSTAGSFTYFDGHQFSAIKNINAGEEIFADYGEEWLDVREQMMKQVPRSIDYRNAAKIISRVFGDWNLDNITSAGSDVIKMVNDIISVVDKKVGSILPKSTSDLRDLNLMSQDNPFTIGKKIALGTVLKRDVPWIIENGICLDNLVPGSSTLPQAGRGAFASRPIHGGSIITPVPLLQIPDRTVLDMYSLERDEDGLLERINDDILTQQLLVNYCFGHDKSSLLLCPTTNAVLINHCSERRASEWNGKCKSGPNAAIRWAKSWDKSTNEWLNYSHDEISEATKMDRRGISLEVYALRDIEKGEEVTIDYGESWEDAFLLHKSTWTPPPVDDYVPVKIMNERETVFRTVEELKTNPYPSNVRLACFKTQDRYDAKIEDEDNDNDEIFPYFEDANEDERKNGLFGYRNSDEILKIDKNAPNQIITVGKHQINRKLSSGIGWDRPCNVLERHDNNTYTVRILRASSDDNLGWERKRQARIILQYPAESIKFVTVEYRTDAYLPGAFRHAIGIPDSMFPNNWKNFIVDSTGDDPKEDYDDIVHKNDT